MRVFGEKYLFVINKFLFLCEKFLLSSNKFLFLCNRFLLSSNRFLFLCNRFLFLYNKFPLSSNGFMLVSNKFAFLSNGFLLPSNRFPFGHKKSLLLSCWSFPPHLASPNPLDLGRIFIHCQQTRPAYNLYIVSYTEIRLLGYSYAAATFTKPMPFYAKNTPNLLAIAKHSAEDSNAYQPGAIISIVFAAMAVEAFVNDFIGDVSWTQ